MKIDIDIPDGKSDDWEVSSFSIDEEQATMINMQQQFGGIYGRGVRPGEYKRLTCNDRIIMSNTPAEIRDHVHFIHKAMKSERVLINGLGLGVALTKILESKTVKLVRVIEYSDNVLELVAGYFDKDPRVEIILADALEYSPKKGEKFDVVWHDIWPTISEDNIPDMCRLHRKYGRRTKWQGSWCRSECERMRRESKRSEEERKMLTNFFGGMI